MLVAGGPCSVAQPGLSTWAEWMMHGASNKRTTGLGAPWWELSTLPITGQCGLKVAFDNRAPF